MPGGLRWLERGYRRSRPPSRIPQQVEAAVGGDAVQPGAQRGTSGEPRQAPPGGQHRLLEHVLGVGQRAEQPVAVQLHLAPVRLGELAERLLVAAPGAFESCGAEVQAKFQ